MAYGALPTLFADAVDLPQDWALVSAGTTTRDSAVRTLAEELAELARLAETGIDYVIYHGSAPGLSPSVYLPQWRRLLAEVESR